MDRITDRVRKLNISTYKRYNMLENNEKNKNTLCLFGKYLPFFLCGGSNETFDRTGWA